MAGKRFHRMGRSCPVSCKEICCYRCNEANGSIDFGPGTPIVFCKAGSDKNNVKNNHGIGCKSFKPARSIYGTHTITKKVSKSPGKLESNQGRADR